jgi:hypothetical protein
MPTIRTLGGGFLAGWLFPFLIRWFGRWRAKRKLHLETELRNAYFQQLRASHFVEGADQARLVRLHAIWGKILDAYEGRRLDPESADALDKLAREYDEYLRRELVEAPES